MTDWREHPATDAQKERLKQEGLKYSINITKGEASDLIGSTDAANAEQIEILKYFKVTGASKMSQTDANRKIQEIL